MFVVGYHCPPELLTPVAVVAKLRDLVAVEVVSVVEWDGERGIIRCASPEGCVTLRFNADSWLNLLLESESGTAANHISNNINIALFFVGADVCGIALPESLQWVDRVLAESPPSLPQGSLAWQVVGLWCHADLEALRGNSELATRLRMQACQAAEKLSQRTTRFT
jgi:hypothetical protein